MQDIPRYFHEQMDEMRAGMKRGFTPPRVTMEGRDASITAVTEATPEDSLFYTPFQDMPGSLPTEQARAAGAGRHDHSRHRAACVCRAVEVHAGPNMSRAAARRSRRRICRMARLTTGRRSANSRLWTWTRPRFTRSASRRWPGCTTQMFAVMKETRLQGRFSGVPAVSADRSAVLCAQRRMSC